MNERIKQLADQAGITETATGSHMICEEHELEAFARSIVQECLQACSRANEIRHFVPPGQQNVVLDCMREIESILG